MLSIIICSVDDLKFLRVRREYERVLNSIPFEIVRIDDAKGMAEGYNRGARLAKYDQLVFSHDDIEILEDDFGAKLTARLAKYDMIGVACSSRVVGACWHFAGPPCLYGQIAHLLEDGKIRVDIFNSSHRVFSGMKVIDGVFMATHRRVVEKSPFDAELFDHFHLYDLDFSYRAHLAGFNIAACGDLGILHHSLGNFDQVWRLYADRFLAKFKGRLDRQISAEYQWSIINASTRGEAKELMRPELWGPFAG
jgi:GT2 family glycosyltransferase